MVGKSLKARRPSLRAIREEAKGCRDCPLWKGATQTVFGAGPAKARIMLVGEQPGDQEDRTGLPFVGPAGHLLDRALTDVGIDRSDLYVTNAVKHFKFLLRGKRRLHKKPSDLEIAACHQWLARELEVIHPALVVVLGATAARSLFGRATVIERNRGRVIRTEQSGLDTDVVVTVHPSFLLRMPSKDRDAAYDRLLADLRLLLPYLAPEATLARETVD